MSGTEAGHVASLRLLSHGSRVMTCAAFNDVASALKEVAKDASTVSPKMVHEFIGGKAALNFTQSYVKAHKVFSLTSKRAREREQRN